jgi:phosphatidylinositol 4-phosphatase
MDALKKHLSKQLQTYGPMKLVNLVNQKGHEKPIKDAYERAMAEVQVCLPWLSSRTVANDDHRRK